MILAPNWDTASNTLLHCQSEMFNTKPDEQTTFHDKKVTNSAAV